VPLESIDSFTLGKTTPKLINATPTVPAKIINGTGGKIFYKNAENVTTSDTEIAVGASFTTESVVWIISESRSNVLVEHPAPNSVSTYAQIPGFYAGQWVPNTAETGTDTTPAEKKLFVTSLFLPVNKKITGIGYLVGSVGGTDKVVAGLWDRLGNLLAASSETTEGTTVGTAKEVQELEFVTPYNASGPALYFVGLTMNGTTARLRTIPKNTAGKNVFSEEISITGKNKLAKITPPTAFAAGKGPVAYVY